MSYKCPLCLKILDRSQSLERFCLKHTAVHTFTCDSSNLPFQFYCPMDGPKKPNCNDAIEREAVFLRHLGCEAHNPLLETEIPAGLNNWQLQTLEEISEHIKGDKPQEMWFPLMLLRATAEKAGDGRRVGTLIELAGAKNVGKTILAMQAMDEQGYVHPDIDDCRINLNEFIYSRPIPGNNRWIETLHLREKMRRNRKDQTLPTGTPNVAIGDLKAVFISPTRFQGNSDTALACPPTQNILAILLEKFIKSIKDLFSFTTEVLSQQALNEDRIKPSAFSHTVIFYDTAGEASEGNDRLLTPIEKAVDKAAIVIDATEIFNAAEIDENRESSVSVAIQRLRRLADLQRETELDVSLIVTKLDAVRKNISPEEFQQLKLIVETIDDDWTFTTERELLKKWLQLNPGDNHKSLLNRLDGIKSIFFIWTEMLPENAAAEADKQPYSFGLARFISWCLDVSWGELDAAAEKYQTKESA